ncbi:MAG: radical SAM protein [SAR324 cluster bacterium]|nr:radical SAM protein [SAR324 cluster bacterium]
MSIQLNIAETVPCTEAEGPGKRYALWVQGCPLRCRGCCNSHMLEDKPIRIMGVEDILTDILNTPNIEGVTFLGGEPFFQAEGLALLAQRIKQSGLSVMVFSGYTIDQIKRSGKPGWLELLEAIDILVDGPFMEEKRVMNRRWIGSDNQTVYFLSDRYHERDMNHAGKNTIEFHFNGTELIINGFPHEALF